MHSASRPDTGPAPRHERLPAGQVAAAKHALALRLLRAGEPEEDVVMAVRDSFGLSAGRARDVVANAARHARA